ncbi:hypothetical protein [Geodermatophilus sp. SYSU D00696]
MSALMAPVTLTAGPVAAYNVAMVLGPVVSGVLMAVALVPWTQRWTSRLVAGGLYAFSPFQVAHLSVGHVNVVWAVLPPLVLVAVRALAVETPHRPTRAGVLAGGVLAVQTGLYTQTLALTALVLALVTVVLAVRWPHGLLTRGPAAARMTVACVVTYLVLCAYPLYLVLFGPTRPGGPIHPAVDVRADPLNAVIPTSLTATGGGSTTAGQLNSYTGEQGGYVGVVVLLLLVVACLGARSTVARVVTVVGLLAFTFSLGSSLTTRKQDLEVWLPWQLLDDLPLISQADPVRLQVFVAACVAIVVGLWIDRVASMRPGAGRITGAALAIGAVVSWLPAAPLPIAAAETPAFFAVAGQDLRTTDVVDVCPRTTGVWEGGALPMLWQAESGMAYRTTGGYALGSDPTHPVLWETPENLFEGACRGLLEGLPPPDDAYTEAARQELARTGVTVLMVVPQGGVDHTPVLTWAARVAGTSGEEIGGVWLYRFPTR